MPIAGPQIFILKISGKPGNTLTELGPAALGFIRSATDIFILIIPPDAQDGATNPRGASRGCGHLPSVDAKRPPGTMVDSWGLLLFCDN